MGDYQILYGDQPIVFSVRYRNTLRHKVAIHVQPDRRVVIDAPPHTPIPDIKRALLKRARWVKNQLARLEAAYRHVLPRQYVSGETHWYMGKRYLLKIKPANTQQPGAKLLRGMLLVATPDTKPRVIQETLDKWYQTRTLEVFDLRLDAIYPTLNWVNRKPEWQLRVMKKQWGSCSPKGRISLSPMLVKAPRVCIDYVIIHELCHLKYHNHSDAFYRLLKRQLPDWKQTKERLDNLAEQILV